MPIDIDNIDVSDITIDGQNVREVTVDGNVVFKPPTLTNVGTINTSFEDSGDWDIYGSGDFGISTKSEFVRSGSRCLELGNDDSGEALYTRGVEGQYADSTFYHFSSNTPGDFYNLSLIVRESSNAGKYLAAVADVSFGSGSFELWEYDGSYNRIASTSFNNSIDGEQFNQVRMYILPPDEDYSPEKVEAYINYEGATRTISATTSITQKGRVGFGHVKLSNTGGEAIDDMDIDVKEIS